MNITVKTLPHEKQAYPTVGNWTFKEGGHLLVEISDMGNEDYQFLVGLHEIIEAYLCKKRGINEEDVTDFDKVFESHRLEGNTDEPGDHADSPYREEHFFATSIERLLAQILDVDWDEYTDAVNDL